MAWSGLLVVALAGAWVLQRRLHKLAFIPGAPSRSLSHEPVDPVPAPGPLRVLYVGHSLINEHIPAITAQLADSLGVAYSYALQLTSGGSLKVNWEREQEARSGRIYQGIDARQALTREKFDAVVLAEAVAIDDHLRWSDPPGHLNRWYDLAVESQGKGVRVYFYEVWDHRDEPRKLEFYTLPGSWREHTLHDLDKFEYIVDAGRAAREQDHAGGPEVFLIPGAQAMVALVEAVRAGKVPGIAEVDALFADSVHPSAVGNYFMALVHVACLARRSPVGATHDVVDANEQPIALDAETARVLSELAWDVVRTYPRQGFRQDL